MEVLTPTKARSGLYAVITNVNRDSAPALIAGADDDKSAYIVGKRDYEAMLETLALLTNGQLQDALARENEPDAPGTIDDLIAEIDNED
ncbi:type II toxin-antitoxin system Phd/YefM family antitoxin [Lacticaseibacillus mingshuiensis]|uniref:Antitoxin n=1 Tax=Lacticaseibacillus mingshuiensis TaxID=2799574 RepID=A0ABW4CKJ9_9LACO|nr:type II toxin-antitoxin system Phd/YefM family antitoxin [Lacticaseibacillus mingshuiensis]